MTDEVIDRALEVPCPFCGTRLIAPGYTEVGAVALHASTECPLSEMEIPLKHWRLTRAYKYRVAYRLYGREGYSGTVAWLEFAKQWRDSYAKQEGYTDVRIQRRAPWEDFDVDD